MRLEQLEYLVEVSNSSSISIAAQNLYISQPALSRSIKALEQELGLPLLLRTVDGVRLTSQGEVLLPQILESLSSINRLKQQACHLASPSVESSVAGTLRLYTLPVLADSLLPLALEQIHQVYPCLDVQTSMLEFNQFPNVRIPKDADLLLLMNISGLLDQTIASCGLLETPLFTGNSFLVVGPNHPLKGKKIVTRSEVLGQKLITHYNGFDLNALYEALTNLSNPTQVVLRSNNTRLIIQTLQKQKVALLTNNLLLQTDYRNHPQLQVIPIKNSRTQYTCLYAPDHPQRQFIEVFIQQLKYARRVIEPQD